jgi:hypothetical protein
MSSLNIESDQYPSEPSTPQTPTRKNSENLIVGSQMIEKDNEAKIKEIVKQSEKTLNERMSDIYSSIDHKITPLYGNIQSLQELLET